MKITTDEVWRSLELLVSDKPEQRKAGLQKIVELQAIRKFPLVVYVISTRINETDMPLRADIIRLLATLNSKDYQEGKLSDEILLTLYNYFEQIRNRQIYSLLQVAIYDNSLIDESARLIGLCSHAGKYLIEILSNRKNPLELRIQSIKTIESVGFLEALPELKRIRSRFERKNDSKPLRKNLNGKSSNKDVLLPLLDQAIESLEEK